MISDDADTPVMNSCPSSARQVIVNGDTGKQPLLYVNYYDTLPGSP